MKPHHNSPAPPKTGGIALPPAPATADGHRRPLSEALLADNSRRPDSGKQKSNASLRSWSKRHPWLQRLAIASVILACLAAISGTTVLAHYYQRASGFDLSEMSRVEAGSLATDRNDQRIGRISLQNRRLVSIDEVPQHLIDALVATEDSRFFDHGGYDLRGIARAAVANLKAGDIRQGGSTITQQLARHAFSLGGRNFDRKFTELFLARRIEQAYSKQEILEHYLNRIYLGCGYWGVGSASVGYFGKEVGELMPDESAMICAIIKSPNRFSPLVDVSAAMAARDRTLNRMVNLELIDTVTCESLMDEPCKALDEADQLGRPQYLLAQLRSEALEILGRQRALDGYTIETAVDLRVQEQLTDAINRKLLQIESQPGYAHQTLASYRRDGADSDTAAPRYLQAAAVVLENKTGRILSTIGGRDFSESQFNRVIQARRSPGSAFFPLVYGAAFETGAMQPTELILDAPLDNRKVMVGGTEGVLGEWSTENPAARYEGEITAGYALVKSKNGAAVKVGTAAGLDQVKKLAERAGVQSPLREFPNTFIGVSEMSLLDLVSTYTAFPNLGRHAGKPHLITRILSPEGEVVYDSARLRGPNQSILTDNTAATINGLLKTTFSAGPAREFASYATALEGDIAGKNGTSYDFEDNWFIGYNADYTWGVWVGFDQPTPIAEPSFSKDTALPIWLSVARQLDPGQTFADASGWRSEAHCLLSGKPAAAGCSHTDQGDLTVNLPVTLETGPAEEVCPLHATPSEIPDGDQSKPNSRSITSIFYQDVEPIRPEIPILSGNDVYGVLTSDKSRDLEKLRQ